MTCAGCEPEDCPQDAWHLHVTVTPHWSWSLSDTASALRRDIERHDMRPVVVTNHFHDSSRKPYRELIPTKHFRGEEHAASREIFRMGVLLNNSGWRVKRLKIEGDARSMCIPEGRALYYETHIKIMPEHVLIARDLGFAISTTEKSTIATRRNTYSDVSVRGRDLLTSTYRAFGISPPQPFRIEAAVLDTAPELDHDWINQ